MHTSHEQSLHRLKAAAEGTRSLLRSLSSHVHSQDRPVPLPELPGLKQIRQQYELLLAASRESINRNDRLQGELSARQQQAHELRERALRQSDELQDLQEEMGRATQHWKSEKKGKRELSQLEEDNLALQQQLDRLGGRQHELQRQIQTTQHKNEELAQLIEGLEREV
jgi:chromosome segregation ATPase